MSMCPWTKMHLSDDWRKKMACKSVLAYLNTSCCLRLEPKPRAHESAYVRNYCQSGVKYLAEQRNHTPDLAIIDVARRISVERLWEIWPRWVRVITQRPRKTRPISLAGNVSWDLFKVCFIPTCLEALATSAIESSIRASWWMGCLFKTACWLGSAVQKHIEQVW